MLVVFRFILIACFLTIFGSATAAQEQDPCTIVFFGATGDQTARKLMPAVFSLVQEGQLSKQTSILGFASRKWTSDDFRQNMRKAIQTYSKKGRENPELWNNFEANIHYLSSDFTDDVGYEELRSQLEGIEKSSGTKGNRIYYLASPPKYFSTIIAKLQQHGLIYQTDSDAAAWTKVIIEKPFGLDLDSAKSLQENIAGVLDPSQTYIIDHYLGKEGVRNLSSFRFRVGMFEPLWNNKHIDHVQITISEDIGIGSRGNLWEGSGWLRDIFQNHLLQLLAAVAMEPPRSEQGQDVHAARVNLLNAIRPIPAGQIDQYVVRGQYDVGMVQGESVLGYRQEAHVDPASNVETYMAAKLFIDNDRWKDVPFYVRGGKRLQAQAAEIAIVFKSHNLDTHPVLYIRIQPKTGIYLQVAKNLECGDLSPLYKTLTCQEQSPREAYETLIYDALRGDKTLFVEPEEHFAAWRLLDPVVKSWKESPPANFPNYDAGTWGPAEADELIRKDGREWLISKEKTNLQGTP